MADIIEYVILVGADDVDTQTREGGLGKVRPGAYLCEAFGQSGWTESESRAKRFGSFRRAKLAALKIRLTYPNADILIQEKTYKGMQSPLMNIMNNGERMM